jgi:hypothetical protein
MKKAKVKKITKMDKVDSYGNTSFIIEFENGDKGFYTSKNADQKNFVVNSEAEYVIEEKEGKEGKKYYKITLPKVDGQPFQRGGKPQVEPRIQMISFAAAYTKDLIVAGKVELANFKKEFETIYNVMISKI